MKKLLLLLACFSLYMLAGAQSLPALQPEQDACNALAICGGQFHTPYSYTGFGTVKEVSQPTDCFDESNSVWFKIEVATAGDIVFTITPVNTTNDYDFVIYNITNGSCSNLSPANRVRCDGCDINSSPGGLTGLNYTSTAVYSPPGAGPNFLQYITANAGDVFLIMVDNYNSVGVAGFTIDFAGSTATFVGNGEPLFDTVADACDYVDGMTFHMGRQVQCASIAANGSDFVLVPALATVTSAVGVNCSGSNGYAQDITLTFSNPLPPGNYYLKANTGTDGNTLLDLCNVPQPLTDQIAFTNAPLIINPGPDTGTCINGAIQMNVQISGGGTTNTILWSPGTYLSATNIANPVVTPTGNITYTITVTPAGAPQCAADTTVEVRVLQGFNVFNNDTTICNGAAVQINATGDPGYVYNWAPGTGVSDPAILTPLITTATTQTYTVTATHPGCADSSQSLTITVEPVPTVTIPADVTVCTGDTIQLSSTVTPAFGGYTYSWSPAGSMSDPTIPDPVYTAYTTATLDLTVNTSAGCSGNDQMTVTVIPANFMTTTDTALCPNDTAQLHVTGAAQYSWSPNVNLSDTNSATPLAWPYTTQTYTVLGRDASNCLDTITVTVTVHPGALLSLTDSVRLLYGEQHMMNPMGNCMYFAWAPPVGLSATDISNPIAQPDVNTRYYVNASTEHGCVANDSIDVFVTDDIVIEVPNAFTPGNDPNRLLKPVYKGNVTLTYFRIFDRWGQMVYESKDINAGWDGQYKGRSLPMGVYVYTLEAKGANGRVYRRQGNSTMIR